MSENAVEPVVENNGQGAEQQVQPTADETQSTNDFYQGILKDVPEIERPIVEPYLKEWQSRVGKKFDELHSQIKPLESWKQFVDEGYSPDDIIQAVNLAQAINEDPKRIYDALAEHLGLTSGQGPTGQPQGQQPLVEEVETPEPWQAKVEELEKGLTAILEFLNNQQQQTTQQTLEQQLDQVLTSLHEKNDEARGPFDDRYVLTLMANGIEPDEAVEEFYKTAESFAAKRGLQPVAPTVLGNGGGLPAGDDVTKLDDKATRSMVAQMLAAAHKQ